MKSQKKSKVDLSNDEFSEEEDEDESGSDDAMTDGPGPKENSATTAPGPSNKVPPALDNSLMTSVKRLHLKPLAI